MNLQQTAYNAMGIYKGAIVVMEVDTGKILAMVSKPDFNPNEIADIWDSVTSDKENSSLLNRASQGVYPPGSTFKIVTALEYIKENPDTWRSYSYQCSGSFTHGDNTIAVIMAASMDRSALSVLLQNPVILLLPI